MSDEPAGEPAAADQADQAELALIDEAYRTLERARWADSPWCPHCGGTSVRHLRPTSGRRLTRTGAATGRRVWKCATCRRQFSVLSGTVLHGTRIDLRVWLAVIDALASDGTVPTARRIADEHGVSRDAAEHLHRLLTRCCAVETVADCLPAPAAGR